MNQRFIASRSGASATTLVNGNRFEPVSSTLNTSAVGWGTGGRVSLLNRNSGSTGDGIDGRLYHAFIWNRALTEPEQTALDQNPYQILRPVTARLYYVPSATSPPSPGNASATLTAKKSSLAASVSTSAMASSPFSNEFTYEFGAEIVSDATVTAILNAPKPAVTATTVQVFPARSLTAALIAKKPAITATATQTFPARAISGTIQAKKPILAATVSQNISSRFVTATIQAKKPAISGAATQAFPARTLSATLTTSKPTISATAAAAGLSARTLAAFLAAPRPVLKGTASAVTISAHLRAPPWRTVDAGTGSAQTTWAAPLDPNALLDFTVNWNDEMSAGDTIQTAFLALSGQAAAAGLKIHSESHDTDSVTAWLKVDPFFQTSPAWNGTGETHRISCRVSTAVGRIHDRTFTLTVRTT
jgi:hypothetical protein